MTPSESSTLELDSSDPEEELESEISPSSESEDSHSSLLATPKYPLQLGVPQ